MESTLDEYLAICSQIHFDKIENPIDNFLSLSSYLDLPSEIDSIKKLKDKIGDIIFDSLYDRAGVDLEQLCLIKEELVFRHIIEDEDNIQQINLLNYILDCFKGYINKHNFQNNKDLLLYKIKSFSSEKWVKILKLVYTITKGESVHLYSISENMQNIAQSIKTLKHYKFQITYKNSKFIQLPDKDIVKEIENLISSLGGLAVANKCVQQLYQLYNKEFDYIVVSQITSTIPTNRQPRLCWFYLLNLSLKHINKRPNFLNEQQQSVLWNKLSQIVTAYVACYDLEIYYPISFIRSETYLDFISRTTLFNFIFNPRQLSFEQFDCFVDKLFTWVVHENAEMSHVIQEAKYLADFIKSKQSNQIVIFDKNEILNSHFQNLDDYIIKAENLNKDYADPNDSSFQFSNSIYCKPFIQLKNGKLLFVNHTIVLYALFECVYAILRNKLNPPNDPLYVSKRLGPESENLLFEKMEKLIDPEQEILFKNVEYKISKDVQTELNTSKSQGEIDCLATTKDVLLIIQIKNKPITTEAALGNNVNILSDLSMSMFDALEQLTWDDYIFQKKGYIELKNGTKILKNDRRIIKCIVSLYDYQGLQEPQLVTSSCRFFARGVQFNLNMNEGQTDLYSKRIQKYKKDFSSLNKHIQNISNVFAKIIEVNKNKEREIDTIFLNIPFLITLTNRENNLTDLIKMIQCFLHINLGTHNLYATYSECLKKFKNN